MPVQIVDITDPKGGSKASVLVSQGFDCFSWRPALNDGPREMLWAEAGIANGDKRPSSSGIPLLFPFAGRIGDAAFQFEGREYRLEPGDAHGNAIHGFVLNRPWRVVEQNGSRVVGEFQASVDDPAILDRWPSDFRIRVSYEVRGRELLSDIRYENPGDSRLPCGFATHAYFRLPLAEGSDVADTVVTVPADRYWELDRMVPTGRVHKTAANQQVGAGLRLADHQFDTVFTGVSPDDDGRVRTLLADPKSRRVLTQTFSDDFTQCVIYTPGHRQAICIEPYTCVPDAFRLAAEGHKTGLQILEPGQSFQTAIQIDVKETN